MTVTSDVQSPAAGEAETVVRPPRYGWLRETAIVIGFYYVYQTIRSLADHGGVTNRAYGNARRLVAWEQDLRIFHEQAIQQAFLGARWFIKLLNIYYGTLHFVITVGLLVWMYRKRHHAYRHMRNLLGLTTALALVGYWAFPLAPPRLYKCNDNIPVPGPDGYAIGKCFVDTLNKFGGLWSYHSPVAKAVANQYAAMPSLHFAWAVWCGIVMYRYAAHAHRAHPGPRLSGGHAVRHRRHRQPLLPRRPRRRHHHRCGRVAAGPTRASSFTTPREGDGRATRRDELTPSPARRSRRPLHHRGATPRPTRGETCRSATSPTA